jgi:hypothetical protein
MKIKLEVDVEASEMRELLGLPDVTGLQTDVLRAVQSRMVSAASAGDPLAIFKALVPSGLWSVTDWQSMLARALQEGSAEVDTKGGRDGRGAGEGQPGKPA